MYYSTMALFEWWAELSPRVRLGVAVFFLLLSTTLFFTGVFWPWGWAVGVILLLLSGPSDPEKRGYHF